MPTSRSTRRLLVHHHQGLADRRDLRGVRSMGLLADRSARTSQRLERDNAIGAPSRNWARDVARSLNRRFDPEGRDRPLVELAQARLRSRGLEAAPPLAHDPRRVPRPRLPHQLALPAVRGGRVPSRTEDVVAYLDSLATTSGIDWSGEWTRRHDRPRRLGPAAHRGRLRAPDGRRRQGVRLVPPARRELPLPPPRDGRGRAQRAPDHRLAPTGACT